MSNARRRRTTRHATWKRGSGYSAFAPGLGGATVPSVGAPRCWRDLASARSGGVPIGELALVMRGDDGGMPYLVLPSTKLRVGSRVLQVVLSYLDAKGNQDLVGAWWCFERVEVRAAPVVASCGKAAPVIDGLWLAPAFSAVDRAWMVTRLALDDLEGTAEAEPRA